MTARLREGFRRWLERPKVRPWALAGPIVVLLVALPLLRPLRHPDPREVSADEAARLLTIRAVAEHRTFALDPAHASELRTTVIREGRYYSDQPPVLSLLLAGPYWVMTRCGLSFDQNPALVSYLLTVIGTTLPVAAAAGLLYRMARLFELARPWRMGLSIAIVACSGLLSYAVVLNAHAPAAVLVLGAAASVIHVAGSRQPAKGGGWLAAGGLCAALAAVLDPAAVV